MKDVQYSLILSHQVAHILSHFTILGAESSIIHTEQSVLGSQMPFQFLALQRRTAIIGYLYLSLDLLAILEAELFISSRGTTGEHHWRHSSGVVIPLLSINASRMPTKALP